MKALKMGDKVLQIHTVKQVLTAYHEKKVNDGNMGEMLIR